MFVYWTSESIFNDTNHVTKKDLTCAIKQTFKRDLRFKTRAGSLYSEVQSLCEVCLISRVSDWLRMRFPSLNQEVEGGGWPSAWQVRLTWLVSWTRSVLFSRLVITRLGWEIPAEKFHCSAVWREIKVYLGLSGRYTSLHTGTALRAGLSETRSEVFLHKILRC